MKITYNKNSKISATEIGWHGVDLSDALIGGNLINDSYIQALEKRFGVEKGVLSGRIEESPEQYSLQSLNKFCFEMTQNLLNYRLIDALVSNYTWVNQNCSLANENHYRDPKTKELIKILGPNSSNSGKLSIETTGEGEIRKLLEKGIAGNEVSFDSSKITTDLEDLALETSAHDRTYWDPKTKGVVKTSPGYNFQIPEVIIETTKELNHDEIIDSVKKYLQSNKLA